MYGKDPGGEQNESWDRLAVVVVVVLLCRV